MFFSTMPIIIIFKKTALHFSNVKSNVVKSYRPHDESPVFVCTTSILMDVKNYDSTKIK